jgi:adenosylmethionine-8-amino-7-oxononanoate aminotransferase
LPHELDAASLVDDIAFELGLLVSSTHSTSDGYAGDEILLAPAYTSTDQELSLMVERFAATIQRLDKSLKQRLGALVMGAPRNG